MKTPSPRNIFIVAGVALSVVAVYAIARRPAYWYLVERNKLISQLETIGGPHLERRIREDTDGVEHSIVYNHVRISAPFMLTAHEGKVTGGGLDIFVELPYPQDEPAQRLFDLELAAYEATPELILGAHLPREQQRLREAVIVRSFRFGTAAINGQATASPLDKAVHVKGPRGEVVFAAGPRVISAMVIDPDKQIAFHVMIRANDARREVAEEIAAGLEIASSRD